MVCSVAYWMSGLSVDAGDFFYYLTIAVRLQLVRTSDFHELV
jgi:hypothetical protein